jgi:DNA repair ATPase RecN
LIPGSPAAVREIAGYFQQIAGEATAAASALGGAVSQIGEPGTWRGAGAGAALDHFQALAAGLRQVSGSFGEASGIAQSYAVDLEQAQTTARELQQEEQQAIEELQQVHLAMRQVEQNMQELVVQAETAMASNPEAAPAIEAALQQELAALRQELARLEQQQAQLEERIARARQDMETLRQDWQEQGAAYAERIAGVEMAGVSQLGQSVSE